MSGPYDDIIHLPHPNSKAHPRMTIYDRAAQFAPFAALTGHEAAIRETARLTEQRLELDEDAKANLDLKLRMLTESKENRPKITITYFKADQAKAGGSYETVTQMIKKIDRYEHSVVLEDGSRIAIEDIFEMEGDIFRCL